MTIQFDLLCIWKFYYEFHECLHEPRNLHLVITGKCAYHSNIMWFACIFALHFQHFLLLHIGIWGIWSSVDQVVACHSLDAARPFKTRLMKFCGKFKLLCPSKCNLKFFQQNFGHFVMRSLSWSRYLVVAIARIYAYFIISIESGDYIAAVGTYSLAI